MSNPVGADTYEWIELANLSSSAMLLTDVMLSDEQNEHVFSEVELQSGEYRSFSKDITGLALQNDGELLRLSYSGITIDQMGYRETYEGVSIGRMPESDELAVFCGPSPNVENTMEPTAITIDVQSGQLQAHGATSVNLQALAASGTSLKNVSCLWQFGELDVSTSCNPLSYRFEAVGEHTVTLEATNVCQQTQTSSLLVTILPPVTTTSTTSTYNSSSTNDSDADCKHDGDDQVVISEFIPNPTGSDDEEWIELYNPTNQIIELCNLWLDDSEGGSSPYRLDDYSIAAYSYLVIPRASSRLALNNTDDAARLLIKERQNYNVQSEVFYQSSNEGQSYSLREDGEYAWTPYVSPGEENTFKTYNRQHEYETIVISSALPNPDGQDSGAEWLELTNISDTEQILDGWYLENAKKSNVLGGMLQPGAVKRFIAKDVGITLKNTEDTLKLYSPDTMLQSTLTWTKAVSGRVYERVELFNDIIEVNVTEIIDGDTVEVEIEDVSLLPQDVQEQLGVFTGDVTFTVRMLGIDAPETNHPTEAVEQYGAEAKELVHDLLLQETVQLTFDEARLGKYNRVLAYVTLPDGHSVQEILLRRGLAQMYDTYPFSQLDWYQLLQQEAEVDEIGMWSDPNVADVKEVAGVAEVSQLEQTSDISATSATLVVEQITYTPIKLQFREIYSAPNDDEDEWIVLYNPTNENVNLTGYILDDVRDGGSKQHILGNYIINAQSELYLPSFITLNNNGDEVWLLTPDAQHSISLEIPKLKHGQSYALVVEEWCVTDQPTPYEQNICTIKSAVTSLKQISSKQISTVTPITDRWVTYENTIEGNLSSEPLRADWVEDLLTTQAIASDGTESSTASIWSEIIQLVLILLFAGGGMYWWIRKK
jgi:endonuclease YncB( thermonuclease family)